MQEKGTTKKIYDVSVLAKFIIALKKKLSRQLNLSKMSFNFS